MKRIKCIVAISVTALLTICAGQASAQQTQASNQAVFGASKTVDLVNARSVDITAGAQSVTDHNGNVIYGAFVHVEVFTYADAAKNYVRVGTSNVYINLSQVLSTDCVNSASIINWHNGAQTVNDGCALASQIHSLSRR